jgi:L-fucose mutarotase
VLKGLDPLLSGALLKVLDELGHGDQLVLADRNFPAFTQGLPVVRVDVESSARVLDAILSVFPLDTFIEHPIERMGPQHDPAAANDAQLTVLETARRHDGRPLEFGVIPRFEFYERAKRAHVIVQTLETAPYCDFILTKGVV